MAKRLYLVPIHEEMIGNILQRWPEYFALPRFGYPGIVAPFGLMDYGFIPSGLLVSDLSVSDHASLTSHPDVYSFPEIAQLNTPVNDPAIDAFLEGINIPTDWLTPSTTWLELLRNLAGMFQFNQRYAGIAAEDTGERHSLFDNVTLDDTYNDLPSEDKIWFDETVAWFSEKFNIVIPQILPNMKFRLLLKSAGSFWDGRPFFLGGLEF